MKISSNLSDVENLNRVIDRYESEGKNDLLAQNSKKLQGIERDIKQKEKELDDSSNKLTDLRKSMSNLDTMDREIRDNIQLREYERHIEADKLKEESLKKQLGNHAVTDVSRRYASLEKQQNEMLQRRNQLKGEKGANETTSATEEQHLSADMFKDIDERHRIHLVKLKTTDLSCSDLNKV